ncbi:LIP1-like protein [Mya arenaria]|uniref:LIP1-like protein n=1 Tax=Mya arenaria TaxID=6604 RepID=A0ABY7FI82_MYAAR|nr:uncharacterized protein LOC128207658 [Mya arenaria]WAR20408.1 LIP1-like protein [Mya arenaria]
MEHLQILILILAIHSLFCNFSTAVEEPCSEQSDCQSCTNENDYIPSRNVICQWCELDRQCYSINSNSSCENEMNDVQNTLCPEARHEKYSPEEAYRFALLSAVAYAEPEYVQKCLSHSLSSDDFELVEAIGRKCDLKFNDYKECFAFSAISHKRGVIILSYRGTAGDEKQLKDEAKKTFIPKKKFRDTGKVHYYFHYAFNKLYDPCIKESIRKLAKQYNNYTVVVTGHSLGGAMASLAAVALIQDGIVHKSRVSLYTYGMPRAGNKKFAYLHDKRIERSWRIVHYKDIVARIPPRITFAYHHGREIYYPSPNMTITSKYVECQGNEDKECSRGQKLDFKNGTEYHISYFNITFGDHCKKKLRYRRRSEEPRFPDGHCQLISLKDAENMAQTEIRTVTLSKCDFETDFCDWSRAPGSTFNFQRHKGPTDVAGKTGPRTACNGTDGYFIYADATGNLREMVKLRSPNFPKGQYCFEFWYHMYGKDMGSLKIWVFVSGMDRKLLKKYEKNQGRKWVKQRVNVDFNKGQNDTIHFEFEARIGNNFASDIALDDISITPGLCL